MNAGTVIHATAASTLGMIKARTVAAIITEPPTNIDTVDLDEYQGSDVDRRLRWTRDFAVKVRRVLRPGGSVVMVGTSRLLSTWEVAAARAGLDYVGELAVLWSNVALEGESRFDLVRWYVRPGLRYGTGGARRRLDSNVIVCDQVPMRDRQCVTEKPVELMNVLVTLTTRSGDLVVDPFCGSGATLVAAEMCERDWIGSDVDEGLVEIATRRTRQVEVETYRLGDIATWRNQYELTAIGG